jgi:hypothetical protein
VTGLAELGKKLIKRLSLTREVTSHMGMTNLSVVGNKVRRERSQEMERSGINMKGK